MLELNHFATTKSNNTKWYTAFVITMHNTDVVPKYTCTWTFSILAATPARETSGLSFGSSTVLVARLHFREDIYELMTMSLVRFALILLIVSDFVFHRIFTELQKLDDFVFLGLPYSST